MWVLNRTRTTRETILMARSSRRAHVIMTRGWHKVLVKHRRKHKDSYLGSSSSWCRRSNNNRRGPPIRNLIVLLAPEFTYTVLSVPPFLTSAIESPDIFTAILTPPDHPSPHLPLPFLSPLILTRRHRALRWHTSERFITRTFFHASPMLFHPHAPSPQ
jgi:hypothetical protein